MLGFGLRRKVSIAAVYSMRPEILILDEPTTGLDWQSTLGMIHLVQDLHHAGHTILLVTHDMKIAAMFTELTLVLREGKVLLFEDTRSVFRQTGILRRDADRTAPDCRAGQQNATAGHARGCANRRRVLYSLPPVEIRRLRRSAAMSFSADIYVERDSWLHRMDPRIKVLYVTLGIVAILLFKSIFVILLALVLTQLLILSAQVPRDNLAWVWRRMIPINILIPVLFVLFYPEGPAVLQFWFIKITPLAFVRGLALALRLDAIAFLVFSWMFTTDQTRIVRSFVKLGLPYNGGLVIAISLRYIPTFYGTYTTVAEAQQARALDLRRGNFSNACANTCPSW